MCDIKNIYISKCITNKMQRCKYSVSNYNRWTTIQFVIHKCDINYFLLVK